MGARDQLRHGRDQLRSSWRTWNTASAFSPAIVFMAAPHNFFSKSCRAWACKRRWWISAIPIRSKKLCKRRRACCSWKRCPIRCCGSPIWRICEAGPRSQMPVGGR